MNDSYLNRASTLSIARTIIHETVHAYLRKQTNPNKTTDPGITNLLYDYDIANGGTLLDTHHGVMSQFILGMAVSFYNWDKKFGPTGGSLGFDYYYKMAFGGLVNPSDPTQLINEAKAYIPSGSSWEEINQILNNEKNGNYEAKGTKCN